MDDAGFLAWLRDDSRKKVILGEITFAYESGGAMTTGTIYLANHPYITSPSDIVPNRRYRDVILRTATISSGIDLNTLGGQSEFQVGRVELDNADGSLDFLFDLIVDGREMKFFVGDKDWPRGWFRQVLSLNVLRFSATDETRISVEVVDRRLLADAAVQGSAIASGPDVGKLRPLIFGSVLNLAPRFLSATDNTYAVMDNYAAGAFVADVRDAGVSLGLATLAPIFSGDNVAITANAGTDTITRALHGLAANDVVLVTTTGTVFAGLTAGARYWVISAGLTANDFRLSASRGGAAVDITGTSFSGTMSFTRFRYMDTVASNGNIQLSTSPSGQVTCDVQSNSTVRNDPFALAADLIAWYGNVDASLIDTASFDAADTALIARYFEDTSLPDITPPVIGIAVMERANLATLVTDLLRPVGGWWGVDYDGKVRAGVTDLSRLQSVSASKTLSSGDVEPGLGFEIMPISYGGMSILVWRNWTRQTDGLSTSITAAERAVVAAEFRTNFYDGAGYVAPSATYLPQWWDAHLTAISQKIESFISFQLDNGSIVETAGGSIATELVKDARPHHQVARVVTGLGVWNWKLGDVVFFTHPRFGLSAGRNFRVAARQVDLDAGKISLTLITQKTPDYTTSDYP